MKKIIIILIVAITNINCIAQMNEGAILLEGFINLHSTSHQEQFGANPGFAYDADYKQVNLGIRPQAGFFILEDLVIGAGISYQSLYFFHRNNLATPQYDEQTIKEAVIALNPYITKFSKLNDKLYLMTTLSISVGKGKRVVKYDEEWERSIFTAGINIAPGLTYFFSNKWAFRGGFGQLFYTYRKEKLIEDMQTAEDLINKRNDYGINFSFNTFTIGFQYFLNAEDGD